MLQYNHKFYKIRGATYSNQKQAFPVQPTANNQINIPETINQ